MPTSRQLLFEIEDPVPELAALAGAFRDLYDELRVRLFACVADRIPGAETTGDRLVVPVRLPRAEQSEAAVDPDLARRVREILTAWGATDIDIPSNRLTWWDGRKMRIGGALRTLYDVSRSPERWKREVARLQSARPDLPEPPRPDPETLRSLLERFPQLVQKARTQRQALDEPVAVLTFDPVENAHRSARRAWVTCYDPERYHTPSDAWRNCALGLARGDLVLWLTDRSDAQSLRRPLARTAIDAYLSATGPGIMLDAEETHGEAPLWWPRWVADFVRTVNRLCATEKVDIYRQPARPVTREVVRSAFGGVPSFLDPERQDLRPLATPLLVLPRDASLDDLVAFLRRVSTQQEAETDLVESIFYAVAGHPLADGLALHLLKDRTLAERLVRFFGELALRFPPLAPYLLKSRDSGQLRRILATRQDVRRVLNAAFQHVEPREVVNSRNIDFFREILSDASQFGTDIRNALIDAIGMDNIDDTTLGRFLSAVAATVLDHRRRQPEDVELIRRIYEAGRFPAAFREFSRTAGDDTKALLSRIAVLWLLASVHPDPSILRPFLEDALRSGAGRFPPVHSFASFRGLRRMLGDIVGAIGRPGPLAEAWLRILRADTPTEAFLAWKRHGKAAGIGPEMLWDSCDADEARRLVSMIPAPEEALFVVRTFPCVLHDAEAFRALLSGPGAERIAAGIAKPEVLRAALRPTAPTPLPEPFLEFLARHWDRIRRTGFVPPLRPILVSLTEFDRPDLLERLIISSDSDDFRNFVRHFRWRGAHVLARALRRLLRAHPDRIVSLLRELDHATLDSLVGAVGKVDSQLAGLLRSSFGP